MSNTISSIQPAANNPTSTFQSPPANGPDFDKALDQARAQGRKKDVPAKADDSPAAKRVTKHPRSKKTDATKAAAEKPVKPFKTKEAKHADPEATDPQHHAPREDPKKGTSQPLEEVQAQQGDGAESDTVHHGKKLANPVAGDSKKPVTDATDAASIDPTQPKTVKGVVAVDPATAGLIVPTNPPPQAPAAIKVNAADTSAPALRTGEQKVNVTAVKPVVGEGTSTGTVPPVGGTAGNAKDSASAGDALAHVVAKGDNAAQDLLNTSNLVDASGSKPVAAHVALTNTPAIAPVPQPAPEAQFAEANHAVISTAIRGQLLPSGGTLHIRLDPPELGALQVTVKIDQGVVSASFETSNDDATKLLSHSLGQLKQALESQGVTVDHLHVQQAPKSETPGGKTGDDSGHRQGQAEARNSEQDQQRREMLRRMWARVSGNNDPLDLVA